MLVAKTSLAGPINWEQLGLKGFEAGKLSLVHRMLDVAMPQIGLQRTGINAPIGQLVAAVVARHARVAGSRSRRDAESRDHLTKATAPWRVDASVLHPERHSQPEATLSATPARRQDPRRCRP